MDPHNIVPLLAALASIGSFVFAVLSGNNRKAAFATAGVLGALVFGYQYLTARVESSIVPKPVPQDTGTPTNKGVSPGPARREADAPAELPVHNTIIPGRPAEPVISEPVPVTEAKVTPKLPSVPQQEDLPKPNPKPKEEQIVTTTSQPCPPFRKLSKAIAWTYKPGSPQEVKIPIVTADDAFTPLPGETCTVAMRSGAQFGALRTKPPIDSCKEIDLSVNTGLEASFAFYVTLSGCRK